MDRLYGILCAGALLIFIASGKVAEKPNFLFILVDDLGVRDLGYAGSSYYETPHIDEMASKSMIFAQGYAGSRVCSPSRATILTGKFTAAHGITDWIGARTGPDWRGLNRHDKMLPAGYRQHLAHDELTLAEVLQENGYATFFAGKWHLGSEGSYPEDHGFEINVGGWEKGSPMGGYFAPFKNPNLKDRMDGENLSMRLAKETARFLRKNKRKPFFAMLSFYAVHGPIQTTQEKWLKYQRKAKDAGIPETGFTMEKKLPIRQAQDNPVYAGLVESMDDAVGLVLEQLRKSGLDENTVVIFTSDNGGVASGDAYSTSNLPWRGGKGYQWEGGIRVPYLVYVPWANSAGKENHYPVSGADIYPTILDYAGIEMPRGQDVDGISLKQIVDERVTPAPRTMYWHYPHYGNQGGDPSSIIREGKWKLIRYYEGGEINLFDLEADPYEKHNLADRRPEMAEALESKLIQWLEQNKAQYPESDPMYDHGQRIRYDSMIVHQRMPALEAQRLEMLSEDFTPNPDWWGSMAMKD